MHNIKMSAHDIRTALIFVTGFRWLGLLIVLLVALVDPGHFGFESLLLSAAVAYTLAFTLIAWLRPRFLIDSPWSIGIDLLVCFGLLYASGPWHSPYYIYSMSPIMLAGFMRGARQGVIVALASIALYLAVLSLSGQSLTQLLYRESMDQVTTTLSYLIPALFFAYPAHFMRRLEIKHAELGEAKNSLAESNRELKSLNRQLMALQTINAVLQSFLELPRVIESVTEGLRYGLDFERAVIGIVDETETKITDWHVVAGFDQCESACWDTFEMPVDWPAAKRMFDERRTMVVDAGNSDTIDQRLSDCLGVDSYIIVPLAVRTKPVGIIILDNAAAGRPTTKAEMSWLTMLANQAAIAVNNAQLYKKAQELATLAERNRIAMEMHDGLSQTLSGARLILTGCEKLLSSDSQRVKGKLAYLDQMLARSYEEMRYAIFNLRLPYPAFDTLTGFFERYLDEFRNFTHMETVLTVAGNEDAVLCDDAKLCLSRVLQELLNNARKHSEAKNLSVSCRFGPRSVTLVIADDGCGFDLEAAWAEAEIGKTFGLVTAQERVGTLGGELTVATAPGEGTTVTVTIPCAADQGVGLDKSISGRRP
jgi:signal transduction histidine kinase